MAAANTSAVTLVSLRTTSASYAAMRAISCAGSMPGHHVDLAGGAEPVHAVRGDRVGDQDAQDVHARPRRAAASSDERRLCLDGHPTPAGWPLTWTLRTTA